MIAKFELSCEKLPPGLLSRPNLGENSLFMPCLGHNMGGIIISI